MTGHPDATGSRQPPPALELERRYAAARAMAESAGRLLLARFRGELEVHLKERDSAVTDADHAAEEMLRHCLGRDFPEDSIIGEELGHAAGSGAWCWTLDPLDGTHNFIGGIPLWSVAVGALYRGVPVIGVIHDPCHGEMYAAARARGAYRGDDTLRVAGEELHAMSLVAVRHRFLRGRRSALLDSLPTRKFRCLGSLCLEMALVASGALGAHLAGSARLWEAVAGAVLIDEAGGLVHDLAGHPVFPLPDPPHRYAEHRFGLVGGSPPAVAEIVAQLRRLPST